MAATPGGDTVNMRSAIGTTFVVFFNNYSCRDCFSAIDTAVSRAAEGDQRVRMIVLVRVTGGVIALRIATKQVRRLMPGADAVLFDIVDATSDPWPPNDLQGGLFGVYHVSKTPAILVLKDACATFLDHDAVMKSMAVCDDGAMTSEQSLFQLLTSTGCH